MEAILSIFLSSSFIFYKFDNKTTTTLYKKLQKQQESKRQGDLMCIFGFLILQ